MNTTDLEQLGDHHRQKLATLVEKVAEIQENERRAVKKVRDLSQQLLAEKIKLEKTAVEQSENHEVINQLKEQLKSREQECDLFAEQEQIQVLAVEELTHELEQLNAFKAEMEKVYRDAEEPRINAEKEEISLLKKEMTTLEQKKVAAMELNSQYEERTRLVENEIKTLQDSRVAMEREVQRASLEPQRLKKQRTQFELAVKALEKEHADLLTTHKLLEKELESVKEKCVHFHKERENCDVSCERSRRTLELGKRLLDEHMASLTEIQVKGQEKLEEKKLLLMNVKQASINFHLQSQETANMSRVVESLKKEYRRKVSQRDELQSTIAPKEAELSMQKHTLSRLQAEHEQQSLLLKELQAEIELFIGAYLKLESVDKTKKNEVSLLMQCEKELVQKINEIRKEEQRRQNEIRQLSLDRDATQRQLVLARRQEKEAVEELRVKQLEEAEVRKRLKETVTQQTEFVSMYEAVKGERNKLVGQIQAVEQRLAEMRERHRVMAGERAVLGSETVGKNKDFVSLQSDSHRRREERAKARAEANKLSLMASKLTADVEQSVLSIDRLNGLLNRSEAEMLALKQQFQQSVEQRNFTGLRLIDRHDELAVLWERTNAQERLMHDNADALGQRDEEKRRLAIAVSEFERQLFAVAKHLPEVPELAKEATNLRRKLQEEEKKSEELARRLTQGEKELRYLPTKGDGSEETPEALRARLDQMETHLAERKEVLLEKELILEELRAFTDKLQQQAKEGKDTAITINSAVNAFQARVKELTRAYQACVAELSMFQAEAMRLKKDRDELHETVQTAWARLNDGVAPTAEAEAEFQKMLKREEQKAINRELYVANQEERLIQASGVVRTRAEPRVMLYEDPDDPLGMPRAYGAFPPMMPSVLGANMRHIRKPQPRVIDI